MCHIFCICCEIHEREIIFLSTSRPCVCLSAINKQKMWPEIESTKTGNKRELKLHGAAISERIDNSGLDASIFDLVNLNLLNISDTSLKILPAEISNLTNLQTILLFGNELTELPQTIGKLDKLKVLDVSRNKLASMPQELSELINLTTINLSNNELGN